MRKTTDPSLDIFHRSSSATVLTEPLLRAFTGQMSNPNTFTSKTQIVDISISRFFLQQYFLIKVYFSS